MPARNVVLLGLVALVGTAVAAVPVPHTPTPDEDDVVTTKPTIARARPGADAEASFEVAAGEKLIWVTQMKKDGFYRVIRRNKGPQGWVLGADLETVHPHEPKPGSDKVCAATLLECPLHGCAEKDSPEANDNEMKRTVPVGPLAATLNFEDFAQLQRQADERVGEGPNDLTPEQRSALKNLGVSSGPVSEGARIRTYGFIAKGGKGLHVNASGESVNCMLKKPYDNDFHIPIVRDREGTEYQGIVVEMIPQDRPSAWTIDALEQIQASGAQVWIEGGLSYDKVHYVNADPANPFKDEPERMSLWEIHPITKFLVCRKEHCDQNKESDWSTLEAESVASGG